MARAHLPIQVLSLNPALDVTYEVPRLVENQKAHALFTRYDPGGNGVNVGRALKLLQCPATTWGVLGGEIGQLLQHLLKQQLDEQRFVQVEGVTRINGTALEQETGHQYEISGVGPEIPRGTLEALLDAFVQQSAGGVAVLTGSLQTSLPDALYAQLSRRIRKAEGLPVVDCHDAPLRHAIQAHPFLIKPNLYEMETLLGTRLESLTALVRAARSLNAESVDWVCVSMGAEGAVLVSREQAWLGRPPHVEAKCTVGAGDSMVAGLVSAFAAGQPAEQALRTAMACAVGTVQQPGSALFRPDQLEWLKKEVEIVPLTTG